MTRNRKNLEQDVICVAGERGLALMTITTLLDISEEFLVTNIERFARKRVAFLVLEYGKWPSRCSVVLDGGGSITSFSKALAAKQAEYAKAMEDGIAESNANVGSMNLVQYVIEGAREQYLELITETVVMDDSGEHRLTNLKRFAGKTIIIIVLEDNGIA